MSRAFRSWIRPALAATLLAALSLPASAAGIPAAQRTALTTFYKAAGGTKWVNRVGWGGKAGTECSWYGVTCNTAKTSVVALSLNENGLKGTLSPALSKLPGLQTLELEGNSLTGGLPKELGSLANLKALRLGLNLLTGAVPKELGRLQRLEILSVPFNRLSGALPMEIGQLTSLRLLDLSQNTLTGSLPPQLGNARSLLYLDLSSNRLTGGLPVELGNLANLTSLFLATNQLTGALPRVLGNLRNLQQLSVSDNLFTGRIPQELGNLSKLQFLDLQKNQLSGPIPPRLGGATALIALLLSQNQLGGSIPGDLLNLDQLLVLWLDHNRFTGPVPFELGAMPTLDDHTGLDLRFNALAKDTEPGLLADLNLKQVGGDWRPSQSATAPFDPLGLTGLSDRRSGGFVYWTIDVAANAGPLTLTTDLGTGNVDLYVRFGAAPTLTESDASSAGPGNKETVTIAAPRQGRYFVGLRANSPYSGVSVKLGG